jgi:branched-chain amino acid aminotransferase
MEAVKNGFGDALLPGSYETVAEASSSTFLALLDDELVTPPVFDGALPGISRGRLLEMGLCKERSIALNTLQRVRSAWLVTALGLTPVAGIEENLLFHDVSRTETIADALFRS